MENETIASSAAKGFSDELVPLRRARKGFRLCLDERWFSAGKSMLNCKQAAVLATKSMDGKPGLRQGMSLRFHLMMCGGCRNFGMQMDFLRETCRKLTLQGG
jgi:hypothetical protein